MAGKEHKMKTIDTGRTQKQIFDLLSFDEVLLGKNYSYQQVENASEAFDLLTNDEARIIKVINAGLKAQANDEAYKDANGWRLFNDDGKTLNGEFTGQPANIKAVNSMVLTLAKSVYKFRKEMTADEKKAAKEKARTFIKNNDELRQGIMETAAATPVDDDENESEGSTAEATDTKS